MVVSIEERREISRRNGARSRGPKTDLTKFISSRNSLKHGCYALVHNLDSEDPLEDLALRDRWFADVGPRNVAEAFLTEQCFRAHRLSNRVERARQDQLAKQIEAATAPWHDKRDASVGKLWNELAVTNDAKDILAELRQTTFGIQPLAQEVGRHGELLDTQGYWGPIELETMVVLSGCATDDPRMLAEDEDAYRLFLWAYQCRPEPPRDLIEHMLEPANRPPGLRDVDRDVLLPSRAECLERLKQWVDDMLAELRAGCGAGLDRGGGPGAGPADRPGGADPGRPRGGPHPPGLERIPGHVLQGPQRPGGDPQARGGRGQGSAEGRSCRFPAIGRWSGSRGSCRSQRGCGQSSTRPPRARAGPWPRPAWSRSRPSPKPHGWGPRCRRRGSRPDPETNPALRR